MSLLCAPFCLAVCPGQTLSLIWAAIEWLPYDREALVTEREIRLRSLVAGRDVYGPGSRGPLRA
jgi:hypothetical protein